MPIYEYECEKCGSFEHSQKMTDPPLSRCPKCRRKVQRLISASSFQLKGGGWYSDGYQGKAAKSSTTSDAKTTTEKSDTAAPAKTTATPEKAAKKSSAGGDKSAS